MRPGPGNSNAIANPLVGDRLAGLTGLEFFQKFLPALFGIGFVIGVIVFFFVMVIGAIQWIASGGDKSAIEGARGKILNAIIGILVLFSVFAIIKVLEDFFGIKILTLDIGPLKIE